MRSLFLIIFCCLFSIAEASEGLSWYTEQLEQGGSGKRGASLHYNIGTLLLQKGEAEEALTHFREALILEQELPKLYLHAALAQLQSTLEQQDAPAVAGLEEGLAWLEEGSQRDPEGEQWDPLWRRLGEELAYRKEQIRKKEMQEATALQLVKGIKNEILQAKSRSQQISTLEWEAQRQQLKREPFALSHAKMALEELNERNSKDEIIHLTNGLHQAEEWMKEGNRSKSWQTLAKANYRAQILESLEKEEIPLGSLLETAVDLTEREEKKALKEVLREEIDRPLPPTGDEETDQVNNGLRQLIKLKMEENSPKQQLALYQEIGQSESESLSSLRETLDRDKLSALVDKLKLRKVVTGDEEMKQRIERVLPPLNRLSYGDLSTAEAMKELDAALLAWSPSDYLIASYRDLVKEKKGIKRLSEWREEAKERATRRSRAYLGSRGHRSFLAKALASCCRLCNLRKRKTSTPTPKERMPHEGEPKVIMATSVTVPFRARLP